MADLPVDPHHQLPDEDWGQVVRDAKKYRQEHEEWEAQKERDLDGN